MTFGSSLAPKRIMLELPESLLYNLCMFGILIDGLPKEN
jgi:hypothetical protein